MLFRIGAGNQLKMACYAQRFEQFPPEWFADDPFVSLNFGTEQLHDVAEGELIDVHDLLLDFGKIRRSFVQARTATAQASRVADVQYSELLFSTIGTFQIRTHDEIAWVYSYGA